MHECVRVFIKSLYSSVKYIKYGLFQYAFTMFLSLFNLLELIFNMITDQIQMIRSFVSQSCHRTHDLIRTFTSHCVSFTQVRKIYIVS